MDDKFLSQYDGDRETVGKIYRDLQMGNKTETWVENGDLTREIVASLVDDLNIAIKDLSKKYDNRPFYILVHEKKDLVMKRCILRRLLHSEKRPYPEDDTMCFKIEPRYNIVRFCWCLPHWSEMMNILKNSNLFDFDLVEQIKAWRRVDLHHFGFRKDIIGNWEANPNYTDPTMEEASVLKKPLPRGNLVFL